jgi:hypothetical protein
VSARRDEETATRHAGDVVHYPSADEGSCNTMYIMLMSGTFLPAKGHKLEAPETGHYTISGTMLYS